MYCSHTKPYIQGFCWEISMDALDIQDWESRRQVFFKIIVNVWQCLETTLVWTYQRLIILPPQLS
jgi:hypothetical protein